MSGIVYKAVAFYDTKHFHFKQIVTYIFWERFWEQLEYELLLAFDYSGLFVVLRLCLLLENQ